MKQIWIVFCYTLKDAARKKAFKISTIILLLVVLVLCLLVRLTGDSGTEEPSADFIQEENQSDDESAWEEEGTCYYIDAHQLIPGGESALQEVFPGYQIIEADAGEEESLRQQIAEKADISLIVVEEADNTPFVRVITKDFLSGIDSGEVNAALTRRYIADQLQMQGVKDDVFETLTLELSVSSEIAGEMDFTGFILGIIITMLMFFAIYYYGYGVSMSIATEKTSRVMETLVVSAPPSRILIGKCLAMGVLGLLQFGGFVGFAILCYHFLVPANFLVMGMPLSFASFTAGRALVILAYFILGYSLYAVMNAVCGASVSKIEDINSAMMPVTLLAMLSFYVGYFTSITASGTDSLLQKVAIYIPFCSPFIVPFKILNGDVPPLDIVLSLGALVISIILITALSIRIYSASVLHYGNRIKLKDMLKLRS